MLQSKTMRNGPSAVGHSNTRTRSSIGFPFRLSGAVVANFTDDAGVSTKFYSGFFWHPGDAWICLILMVGAVGFELTAPCAQGRCATRLRYAPTSTGISILNYFHQNLQLLTATLTQYWKNKRYIILLARRS